MSLDLMSPDCVPDNPYLLLTPGPLSTSKRVRAALFRDWCTWDDDYNGIVQDIRARLAALATPSPGYSAVLMQGSGTFTVEAVLGSALPESGGRLLVLANGAYGQRLAHIAARLRLDHQTLAFPESQPLDADSLAQALDADPAISHVAMVHCETTTGMLNPVESLCRVARERGRVCIVDAMSSFGGVPLDQAALGADFLISSANKCIQGIPGFGFCVARREALEACAGRARSLSLDLHAQWKEMEDKGGKWRYTSPTHAVRAFAEALRELEDEGGVAARHGRYAENQRRLVEGLASLGLRAFLPRQWQSPVITAFWNPDRPGWTFSGFYAALKSRGFVIYPGKVSEAATFRVGTIGHVFPEDVDRLVAAMGECLG